MVEIERTKHDQVYLHPRCPDLVAGQRVPLLLVLPLLQVLM
jgi:hypothetical protein